MQKINPTQQQPCIVEEEDKIDEHHLKQVVEEEEKIEESNPKVEEQN